MIKHHSNREQTLDINLGLVTFIRYVKMEKKDAEICRGWGGGGGDAENFYLCGMGEEV